MTKKIIYVLAKMDIDDEYGPETVITRVSTDITNIIDTIPIDEPYYDEVILVLEENTTVDICDVISFYRNDAAKYFKEHLPHVLNGCDEECDYIHQCLKNWEDKRQHYLDAKKSVEMVEMSAKEEENERRE